MKLKRCKRSEFIDYINEHWKNKDDWDYISDYSSKDCKIGIGLGCYDDNDKLLGFSFYKPNASTKYWRHKDKYPNIWWHYLIEIHPDHRQQGIGSMLLQEIYRRMPKGYCLVTESEHTDNHIKFYLKNGFIQDKSIKMSKMYFFLRYKEEVITINENERFFPK